MKITFVLPAIMTCLALASGSLTAADEAPPKWEPGQDHTIEGLRVSLSQPVLVARSKSYLWFPTLARLSNGDLMACMSNLRDTFREPEDSTGLYAWSRDGGLTWDNKTVGRFGDAHLTLPNGDDVLFPHYSQTISKSVVGGSYPVCLRGEQRLQIISEGLRVSGWSSPVRTPSQEFGLAGFMINGQTLRLKDGRYLCTLYGRLEGDTRYRLVTAVSKSGLEWKIRGTIADPDCALAPGGDGPCEAAICRLKDGRLMCVFRLWSFVDYGQSFSHDEGKTWSEPVSMQGVHSVQPSLALLKDGMVALSGGRRGLFLWVNRDGTGRDWQQIDVRANHNEFLSDEPIKGDWKTSSYTEIVALDDTHLLYIYDRTPQGIAHEEGDGWKDFPDDVPETNSVWVVHVTVEKNEILATP